MSMGANSFSARHGEYRTLIIAVLGPLALGAAWFIHTNVWHFTTYSPSSYSDYYWPRRGGLIPHIAGGLLAISAGLVQVWLGLTNQAGALHRALGKVYGAGVLLGSLGGYYMAISVPSKHFVYATGLFMLCTAWIITTSMALFAIRRREIRQHRDWMLRSYTVTFAFVTFRLLGKLLTDRHVAPAEDVDAIMAWACWSVPLLIAEPLIQLPALRRPAATG